MNSFSCGEIDIIKLCSVSLKWIGKDMWFIKYKLADETERKAMTEDKLTEFYADFFCTDLGTDLQ